MAASAIANIPYRRIFLSQRSLQEIPRRSRNADRGCIQFLVGVNGSSLPNCSGMCCSLSLAVRAWERCIASSIICGVAEVGGGGFFPAVAGGGDVVCPDAESANGVAIRSPSTTRFEIA
jgi:hypothetical protein